MSPEPDLSPSVAPAELMALRASIEASLPAYLADLERLVNVDCGSYSKAGVDEVGRWTAAFLERLGARVEVHPNEVLGDTVVGTITGRPGGARLLAIGHLDTVFPTGTAAARPFAIRDGIATGPGVTDMKSGLLTGLYALAALREAGELPVRAPRVRGQPRRGDRLARLGAADPGLRAPRPTPASSSSARAPTATSSRRARESSTCG